MLEQQIELESQKTGKDLVVMVREYWHKEDERER